MGSHIELYVILLHSHVALLQVQELLLLSVPQVGREEFSIEALLKLFSGYLADITTQHPLSSLSPGEVNHILTLVRLSIDPSNVLGLYFLKSLRCLALVDSWSGTGGDSTRVGGGAIGVY
ncbi:hypothetical protein E5676_scaffold602G001570 [Cucumis melo var. makuwa]|uniref:Uncharacterized protein n=1 Tax=Cucumis melo var. makuwa TaxID=1194695 RepID=A0A5D3BPK6_CUCMM|nr:hypothetical protein E6C27_scaffold21G003610 [Cucumis melo var. makuwa]TYK00970.1 hypothetical protein E5676_scaffold602G001570 [Cucumis melo var. makuwa]